MRQRILHELAIHSGQHVSGSELADKLGISRVAVWKHIEVLKKEGYQISGTSGKGYKIEDDYNILLPQQIKRQLKTQMFGKEILYYPKLKGSSNKKAGELIREKRIPAGTVVIASLQTEGKGRRGKVWESPSGGTWFSIIIKPNMSIQETARLSLVFAVAISNALDRYVPLKTELKWPNDVYYQGKKLCGILLETSGEIDQVDYVVVGVGINVNLGKESFSELTREKATSLLIASGRRYKLENVLVDVLVSMEKYYNLLLAQGFNTILHEFKDKCFHLNQNVAIQVVHQVVKGKNLDIDEMGSLLVKTENGVEKLTTGDIKLLDECFSV